MTQALSHVTLWNIISQAAVWHRSDPPADSQAELQQTARQSLQHLPEHLLRDMGL